MLNLNQYIFIMLCCLGVTIRFFFNKIYVWFHMYFCHTCFRKKLLDDIATLNIIGYCMNIPLEPVVLGLIECRKTCTNILILKEYKLIVLSFMVCLY